MYLTTLSLTAFRNYEELHFEPSSGLNILVGGNGQGKSAILEAIYLLATSKSHRTSRDTEMITVGSEMTRVSAQVARSTRNDVELEVILGKGKEKLLKINKAKHPRIGDLLGQLNAVIFSTADIEMITGEPLRRRRFMNLEISQTSPQYAFAYAAYRRILDQRNTLLREIKLGNACTNGLDAWDRQLATYGSAVMARRTDFTRELSVEAARLYSILTDDGETLALSYKPSVDVPEASSEQEIAEILLRAVGSRREADLSLSTTTVGPHRDALAISVKSLPAREYASQGQHRSAAIAIKLAEIEVMQDSAGESPVILLDDVMAELDEPRRARVLELTAGQCQTIITTTRLADLGDRIASEAAIFEVASGKVTRQ